jgi:hypothetical protein
MKKLMELPGENQITVASIEPITGFALEQKLSMKIR